MNGFVALYLIACLDPTNHILASLCQSPTAPKLSLTVPK
jgi:hypothetical protein